MAVNQELWQPLIAEGLYMQNPHLECATNADEYVVGGAIVHIPQAGRPAPVKRNRIVTPASVTKRGDTDVLYPLDEFTSDPTLVTNIDKTELSYNKLESIIRDNTAYLNELVGSFLTYRWAKDVAVVSQIVTTGAAAVWGAGVATARKKFTAADIRKAQTQLDNDGVPQGDRYLMLTPDMRNHLLEDVDIKNIFYSNIADYKGGSIPQYAGFNLLVRPVTIRVSETNVVKLPDEDNVATDFVSAIYWHKSCVERALGDIKVFENPDRAEHYGDLISFLVRASGRARRGDNKGVGLIIAK